MRLSGTSECLSDLALDEWASDELDAAARERTASHVTSCANCRARHEDLERARSEFLAAAPSFESHARRFVPQRARPRRAVSRRAAPASDNHPTSRAHRARVFRMLAAASAVALAAVVLLLVLPKPEGTRFKGGPSIGFFVKRGERVQPGDATTVVRPGDLLRFTYSSERDRYFALFNRDARTASVYYPNGAHALRVAAGSRVALDFSVALDHAPGPEQISALFCAERFELEPLRAALGQTGRVPVPDGCQLDTLTLRKDLTR